MSKPVKFTPSAEKDLSHIFRYLCNDSYRMADMVLDWVEETIEALKDHPLSGPVLEHPGIPPDLRRKTIRHTHWYFVY